MSTAMLTRNSSNQWSGGMISLLAHRVVVWVTNASVPRTILGPVSRDEILNQISGSRDDPFAFELFSANYFSNDQEFWDVLYPSKPHWKAGRSNSLRQLIYVRSASGSRKRNVIPQRQFRPRLG